MRCTEADGNSDHLTRVQSGASLSGHTVGERQPRCMHFSGTTVTLGKKVRVRFRRWRSANTPVARQAKIILSCALRNALFRIAASWDVSCATIK